jgi:hypothetical protein
MMGQFGLFIIIVVICWCCVWYVLTLGQWNWT